MEIGDGGESRRRRSKESSSSAHLRDYIQLKEEDVPRRNSLTGLTLSDLLSRPHVPPPAIPVQSNRTLLDIIREEDDPNSSSYSKKNKTGWKTLADKLRLPRTLTSVDIPNPSRQSTSQNQSIELESSANNIPDLGRESLSDLLLRSGETDGELDSLQTNRQQAVITPDNSNSNSNSSPEENVQEVGMSLMALLEGENGEREPDVVGISLMALLAETDRELGLEVPTLASDDDEEEEEAVENENENEDGYVDLMNKCCVCMVRHKGAAFIPCGHAFCRICSRELWVQRGTCPLCNAFITQILDIF